MKIRLAEDADQMYLVREYLQHYSPNFEEAQRYAEVNLKCDRALLAEEDGLILGMLSWGAREGIHSGIAQLTGLRVIPSRRRQGVARSLLKAGLHDIGLYFATRGTALRHIFAFVPEDSVGILQLLVAHGFEPQVRLEGWREAGVGEWLHVLDLSVA